MYQAIYYDRETYTFHLRDDKTGWSEFKYNRPRYRIDPNGDFPTLDGKRANLVTKYDWKDNSLYESDLDAYTAVLIVSPSKTPSNTFLSSANLNILGIGQLG